MASMSSAWVRRPCECDDDAFDTGRACELGAERCRA